MSPTRSAITFAALAMLGACASSTAVLPPFDVAWLDAAVDDPTSLPRTTPITLDVRLISAHGALPDAAGFRARIDGTNGATMEIVSLDGGVVRGQIPAAYAPFDVTFAGLGWSVTSILDVSGDLTGDVFVHPLEPSSLRTRQVTVDIAGRTSAGSGVALWANAGIFGYAWTTTAADSLTVPAVDYPDAPAVRITAYELAADGTITNAVNTVFPWPADGAHLPITFPRPARVPTVRGRIAVVPPTSGVFTVPDLPGSAYEYQTGTDPEPRAVLHVGRPHCANAFGALDCTFEAFDGDLAPTTMFVTGTLFTVTAPWSPDAFGILLPPVSQAHLAGTSLADLTADVIGDGYRCSRIDLSAPVAGGSGQIVWSTFTYRDARMAHSSWPRLPSGLTLPALGVQSQGININLDLIYQAGSPRAPWGPHENDFAPSGVRADLTVGVLTVLSDGR